MNDTLAIIAWKFPAPSQWRRLRYCDYTAEHVNALWRACADNIKIPHRFVCVTDDPAGVECETLPAPPAIYVNGEDACYRRLKAFDPEWQAALGADHVLCLDLDAVFVDDITDILTEAMQHDFTILRGSAWPENHLDRKIRGSLCNYYNGSMWLCRTGARPQFWRDFDPATFCAQREAYRMPNGRRPLGSDQAWITVRSGDAERAWGPESGIVQYRTIRHAIPPSVKLIFFAGKHKPWSREVAHSSPAIAALWRRYA
jgi:hypothetical protein